MTTARARFAALVVLSIAVVSPPVVSAQSDNAASAVSILRDLGFSLSTNVADKPAISFTRKGVVLATPWGDFEATIVSTPSDRMVRVPLSPTTEDQRLLPYVTAGSRLNVDADPVLQQSRPSVFADSGRSNLKAGAGVVFRLDDNVELFGEYQFMRFQRDADGRGSLGPVGTSVDPGGFSLGISVRY